MNEMEFLQLLKDGGAGMNTISTVGILFIAWRLAGLVRRVDAIAKTIGACPVCRKHFPKPLPPLLLLPLMLAPGCVQTSFRHGETILTRTALLTRVEVPNIEVGTNGTFRASLKSDARTEVVEALLKLLATVPK